MTKRSMVFVAAILAILVGGWLLMRGRAIEIPKEKLQATLASAFPLEKEVIVNLKGFDVTFKGGLKNPLILLEKGSDRIGLQVDAVLDGPLEFHVEKTVGLMGLSRYDNEKGALYLDKPQIAGGDFPLKEETEKVLAKILEDVPVYKFDDRDLGQALAKETLKSIEVSDGRIFAHIK